MSLADREAKLADPDRVPLFENQAKRIGAPWNAGIQHYPLCD